MKQGQIQLNTIKVKNKVFGQREFQIHIVLRIPIADTSKDDLIWICVVEIYVLWWTIVSCVIIGKYQQGVFIDDHKHSDDIVSKTHNELRQGD